MFLASLLLGRWELGIPDGLTLDLGLCVDLSQQVAGELDSWKLLSDLDDSLFHGQTSL